MDRSRFKAALIRAFWSFVMPSLGFLVVWLLNDQNLQSIGINDAAYIGLISAALYGLKKLFWPDTTF